MSKRLIIISAAIIIVIIIVAAVVVLERNHFNTPGGNNNGGGSSNASGTIETRTAVPDNVVVPGANATDAPPGVAIPKTVSAGNPSNTTGFRTFDITVQNNQFTPNQINVYQGDTINVKFTAVGKNYDFDLPDFGVVDNLPEGQTTQVQLSFSGTGQYLFYCKSCGGPQSGPVGHIIVAPKP